MIINNEKGFYIYGAGIFAKVLVQSCLEMGIVPLPF